MRDASWNEAILVHVYISLNPVQHNFYRCVASNRYTLIIDFLLFDFCLFVCIPEKASIFNMVVLLKAYDKHSFKQSHTLQLVSFGAPVVFVIRNC